MNPSTPTRVLVTGGEAVAQLRAEDLNTQSPDDGQEDYRRIRQGNNRYKMPKAEAKAKRQARKAAQKAQRRRGR